MKRLIFNFPETIFFHAYLYVFVYKKKNREVSEEMRSKFKLKIKGHFTDLSEPGYIHKIKTDPRLSRVRI